MHYNELKWFLKEDVGKLYIEEFKPKKILILWIEGDNDFSILVTDIDVFPVDRSDPKLGLMLKPVEQHEFDNICNEVLKYKFDGDIDLCGDRDFNGSPPILGNPN